ncbi:Kinesin light chain [Lasiodiplodia theobromae]|uniref:Kinesin light chain n=1 Tax=Lasiodiplodia theobromae TaxID=45133 RepID=A0A5N5D4D5_9PEZI|nr:Kinesin light chain [Lasiodiplodia theobromae]
MTKSDCDACRINCVQQAALCCELALGTERDLTARDTFLALGGKDKTVYEAIVAGIKEPHQPSSRSTLPYFLRPDLVHEYQRRKELEAASEHLDREIGGRKLFFNESQHHPLITVLQSCLAHVWDASGRLSDAASLQSEIVESNRQYYGENHPETIGALAQLAIFQDDLGHTKLAIEIGESVVTSGRKHLSPDDPYLLTAMANLARIYFHAGRFTEAEALQEETVEKHEELLGPEHPNTMRCWLNLAAIYNRRPVPRAKEASRITAMIAKRQIETQGNMHRDALLAETYSVLSEKSNSLATHEILARQTDLHHQAESLLADDDPDRWLIATNLASTQADLGEWDSAEKLFKEAIDHLELILPPGHREIVRVTALFGEKHKDAGLFAAGEKLLYKAMEQDRVADQYSDDGVRSLTVIGISRWEQGRREDAKDIFERVVDIVRSQWDIDIESHTTRTAMSYLADMYIEDGDAKKGLDFHERLVQWFINDQGPHSLFTIRTQSNMAMARMEAGLPLQPSIDLLTELLQRSEEHLGPSHGMTRIIQLNLGGVLSRNGDNERAIAVGEALLASLAEDPASSLIDALDAMQDLAVHYARAGKPLEAKALHVRISEAQRSSPDSPSKFRQMHNFANLCHEENDLAMAISHQRDLVKRQKLYYGDADREVWDSTYYLAYYLSDDPTQLDEALELSLGAWSFFLESLGYQHEKTINAAGLAGCIYAAKGLKEDARIMYERELEGSRAMGNSKVEKYVEHALKHLAALDE